MRKMMGQYGRPDAQHIAVLLTGGHPIKDQHRTVTEAGLAKREHTKIFVVGALWCQSNLQHNTVKSKSLIAKKLYIPFCSMGWIKDIVRS